MCDILYQFHLIVNYFLGFAPWRFPSFRGFYRVISNVIIIFPCYSLKIGLAIQLHFHFTKVGSGLAQPPKLLIYISMDWHSHPTVV